MHSNIDSEINKHDLKRDSSRNTKRDDMARNLNVNEITGRKDIKSLTGDNWNRKKKERDYSNGRSSEINNENGIKNKV